MGKTRKNMVAKNVKNVVADCESMVAEVTKKVVAESTGNTNTGNNMVTKNTGKQQCPRGW